MENPKGILLESGTNEFEIIEFFVGNGFYGINVAKVREIINNVPVTKMPNSHPCIDGILALRGKIMPLLNLKKYLQKEAHTFGGDSNISDGSNSNGSKIIVAEMNNCFIGFKVDDVSRIHRISWTQMEPVPSVSDTEWVIGVVKMPDRLIILLDFEKILSEITPEISRKLSAVPVSSQELMDARKQKTILIAEDSYMLRDLLNKTLNSVGYKTIIAENGQIAWDKINKIRANGETAADKIQMLITDIEMPQMDGHHLIRKIKEDTDLQDIPVIIFSSLINDEMRRKGEVLGAYAQITKPEIEQLIGVVDKKMF